MSKFKLATAAVLSIVVSAPVMAQTEMKGPEGGQRPTETQSPASKTAPAEKMAPQGQGQKGETRKDSERMTPAGETQKGAAGEKAGTAGEKMGTAGEKAGTVGEKAGGHANITSQQRTQIVTEFRSSGVRQAKDLRIGKIHVGAAVPHAVTEYWVPVPASIVETVPAWRSYRAVMVGHEILIIDPTTLEIVYVLT